MWQSQTERSLEDDYPDGAELVSAQARQALISLTEGEALEIVKNTSRGTHFGLEALRRLLCKYDPQNPQANSALLKKVLHPQQCSLDKLREGLESWENLKRKYEERRKKQLEDDICRSCLQQMCPNKLQDHLDLQASRLADYDSMKHEILAYIENVETRKEAKTGSAPMDVDSLAKSKGKGKDSKGKGKMVGVKAKEKARSEKVKVEKTKVRVLGIGTRTSMGKVGIRTIGIKAIGISNGTTKVKERIKVVSLNMETSELQQLRIPKLRVQAKPLINLNLRSQLCLLWKRWPREHPGALRGREDLEVLDLRELSRLCPMLRKPMRRC